MDYIFEIIIPESTEIVHFKNKFRIVGPQEDIIKISEEIRKISKLKDGEICKIDRYNLKISEKITEDRIKPNFIELPAHAWNVMASLFNGSAAQHESNPFDFNSVGYLSSKIPFDIGVEITDIQFREY